jgi:aspartyl-tRNA(Asn)/glutamyl-tRNA(Gln) amidotransferase subunit A
LISEDFKKAFQKVDVIMGPVSPTTAFEIGAINDSVSMYLADIYTLSVNLAGLPGMSIPAGLSNNLPVGLQMIGNYWSEEVLLNVAHQFQTQTDWHVHLPENT